MWWNRKKDDVPEEDAELRALANAYAQLHEKKDIPASSLSTTTQMPPLKPQQPSSPKSSIGSLPELPMDDIIRGSSFSYTRAEAKMYAGEEPCDTWRHFDVVTLISMELTFRNGSVIICRYIWDPTTTATEPVGHPFHIGKNFVSVSAQKA